jgi:signal transduction histidine kinase
LAEGVWPDPQPFDPSQPLAPEDVYRWVEGEGSVSFLALDGTSATLELAVKGSRVLVRVARWQGELPVLRPRLRARFRGVREGVRDATEHLMTGLIWVPTEQQVSFFDGPDVPRQASGPHLLEPVAAGPGGYFFTRGVVTFNDLVRGKKCLFIQDARNGIFVSQAERKLPPILQVGQAIQIGGPLLPGKYAPRILPAGFTILGWQNLPVPVVPSAEAPEASYRDGQWTTIEGVVRSVNADGTMVLAGRQASIPVWVGRSDRGSLEQFVNCTLCVRGVMSLEMFGAPNLLVPSRGFIEIKEPAPELPTVPVAVASLNHAASGPGWVHQVKVAGIVTYRNDRFFFLQDPSGGVRVRVGDEPLLEIGSAVEVVGFPSMEGAVARLTEAAWHPLAASPAMAAARMDPLNADAASEGTLVNVEARLLSRKTRGTDHILELQAGQHVFEAVLETSEGKLPELAAGSLLAVTGVCLLDSASTSAAQLRLLLRRPDDVTLLQGPPWWTWQRTAVLIGVLLIVMAGSLLRIQILNRRFARQQAARLAFARGMLESQESERRRIAASLHDSLGQDLLVIRNQAHLAIQAAAEESSLRQRLEEISATTLQAINEVREITHNLRPHQLDRLGLTQAIRAITRKVSENCSVVFACHVDEIDGIFDKESEIHVYRIVQEGINNVLKHSRATETTVVIKKTAGNLSISIRDNGCGLAANGSTPHAGFGLSGIRERAEIIGGTAKIDSPPGQGVNLQVLLPLQPTTP